ncbi:MAG: hypothetical protein A2Z30_02450 [Chloroflexi bacterium RBG_16_64_43]|nr:MAG: hypothetical protein A2Z30_02450 [Chloroflexi bacterium RBG_16_64_43]
MPYLIDGHNLIGRHPGLSLADPDDERDLLKLLADHARRSRRKLVVFFDRGQTGSRPQRHGSLEVHFVPSPRTADDALLDYLRRLPDPRNWRVVTSDRRVAAQARQHGAVIISADEFLRSMRAASPPPGGAGQESQVIVRTSEADDIEGWLRAFERRDPEA